MSKDNSLIPLLKVEKLNREYHSDVQYITKIRCLEAIENEYGKLLNNDVVLTNERKQHIIERRKSDAFFVLDNMKDTIENYDYILKDDNKIAIFIKHIGEDRFYNYLVVYLSLQDKSKANSVITGIKMNNSKV